MIEPTAGKPGTGRAGGASKKEVFSWCLYDFANSAYTTIIVTAAFNLYFVEVVAAGTDGTRLWGRGYSASMLILALFAPFLGAIADCCGYRKKFLILFTLVSVSATALLFFVQKGDVWTALIIFAVSNIAFNGALHFYNSFLPDVSERSRMGTVSGWGWGLGYVGGLISLLIAYPFIKGGFAADNLLSFRLTFPMTALFFLLFSIPTFIYLKESTPEAGAIPIKDAVFKGLRRLRATFREIRRYKELVRYFIGYLIYTDGISTIIVFSSIFAAAVLGFSPGEIIIYFIVTHVTAAVGAFAFGPVTDKLGPKKTIAITLVVWTLIAFWAFLVQTKMSFYGLGLVAGTVLGANQSASRTMLGLFTPPGKNAEFFGFFAAVNKFAAIIGPLIYGEIASITGSHRLAVLSLALFFITGLLVLSTVSEADGMAAATEDEGAYDG
jgi:UMF1 family MFS transporter